MKLAGRCEKCKRRIYVTPGVKIVGVGDRGRIVHARCPKVKA
jgi:hypothetical protein